MLHRIPVQESMFKFAGGIITGAIGVVTTQLENMLLWAQIFAATAAGLASLGFCVSAVVGIFRNSVQVQVEKNAREDKD